MIQLLGRNPKDPKSRCQRDTYFSFCISMFIAAFFTIARKQGQHRCPPRDEPVRKMSDVRNNVSIIKQNRIVAFSGKWIEIEITMLRETSQPQKDKQNIFPLIHRIQI